METATSIKELIDLLHIDKIGAIEAVHDRIREEWKAPYTAASYPDCKEQIASYFGYHYMAWLNSKMEMPVELAHARAERILQQNRPDSRLSRARVYLDKESGGYNLAVKNSIRGRNGGLIAVCDTIAAGIKQEAVKTYISAVFTENLNPMIYEQRLRFAEEYLLEFGSVLFPGEALEHPGLLGANLEALVEFHVSVINQLRTTVE